MPDVSDSRFRALARSSPWRFTTLRFTHRRASGEQVDALLRRPGWLRVRTASGAEHVVTGVPYAREVIHLDGRAAGPADEVLPADVPVELDADGFVIARPTSLSVLWDDPMWRSFDWVAMLDPVELSTGTVVRELAATTRHGRETWWARMVATGNYEPRCGCCPLLWGAVSERLEDEAGGPTYARDHPDVVYPDSWLVGLDVQTGVVVSTEPLGGDRDDLGFSVTVHAVDED
ncbi:hypothetical protein [Phycicoccus avicenniae]|uniref:hypothetical protein n=1 Tax=Phycicoccus avicenniae TaxID=2828860 RepID=UPI003D278EBE